MKLVLQIALGVFIGALAALYMFEQWRSYAVRQTAEIEQTKIAKRSRQRADQGAKIRELLMRGRREPSKTTNREKEVLLEQELNTTRE
ncbi:MAG: hypothetical protein ACREWG_00750 [Gammaproteobacteria bacterium]